MSEITIISPVWISTVHISIMKPTLMISCVSDRTISAAQGPWREA